MRLVRCVFGGGGGFGLLRRFLGGLRCFLGFGCLLFNTYINKTHEREREREREREKRGTLTALSATLVCAAALPAASEAALAASSLSCSAACRYQ
jgi:hypothetical protein